MTTERRQTPLGERRGVAAMARRQWAWFFTVVVFAAGALYATLPPGHWRRGSAIMGGALLIGAGLRTVLPAAKAGLLAVRGRWVDVAVMTALGVGILVLAFWVPALRPTIDR